MSTPRRRSFWDPWELPLLVRELNEQANQKRTYIVRLVYGLTLLIALGVVFSGTLFASQGSSSLGEGADVFVWLTRCQFWALYLIVPAVTCGCLSLEKERNTLAILLLTTLSPFQIVAQKFLGRFVPIVSFVFLSLPMFGIAFSLGGLTPETVWAGCFLLLLTVAQTCSLAVACSSYFATTVEALMAYYVMFFGTRFVLPFIWGEYWLNRIETDSLNASGILVTAAILISNLTVLQLFFAWIYVERRAFVPPKNVLLQIFQYLDHVFNDMNKVTGGVILIRDGDPLPGDQPVGWRETAKKSLGTFRYLFRVLMILELPLVLMLYLIGINETVNTSIIQISFYLYGIWTLSVLLTTVHSSSLIAAERTRQTLEVLLTTSLRGDELLLEKQQGVIRLFRVLAIPFLTIYLFQAWWFQGHPYVIPYVLLSLLSLFVLQRLLAWGVMLMSLRLKSHMRAVAIAAVFLGIWIALPTAYRRSYAAVTASTQLSDVEEFFLAMHPTEFIPEFERGLRITKVLKDDESANGAYEHPPLWFPICLSIGFHSVGLFFLRKEGLKQSNRLLGRL